MDTPYTPLTRRLLTRSEGLALALLLGFPLLADQLMTGSDTAEDNVEIAASSHAPSDATHEAPAID